MIKGMPSKLKELRTLQGLSQKEAAAKLGLSPSVISAYETGERTPSAEALLALSYLYHCSTDYLLGKKDPSRSDCIDVDGLREKQVQAIRQLVNAIREK